MTRNTLCLLLLLTVFGESWCQPAFLCYSCNSGWGACADSGLVNPSWVGTEPCPLSQRCFVRRDLDGFTYRGCADGFPGLASASLDENGCVSGPFQYTVDEWCMCNTTLCNAGGFDDMKAPSV
ncbi:uncharacterized protein LOC106159881 [Lingula anatina]|uniref:Uncharacterized protein LOC106159881 n=1 Tax=Lingula anatina TaxID=7574 RepID=A0A1S3I1R1_LINAN|nr:uncharacterized protein LOC106159881 [Lingula anatina]|eukprot:XP_013391766.1 uncharacterized protein LOC106159881 [Lingula anatina]